MIVSTDFGALQDLDLDLDREIRAPIIHLDIPRYISTMKGNIDQSVSVKVSPPQRMTPVSLQNVDFVSLSLETG